MNGYKYFAIQFYGECWVSQKETFKMHGQSTECWSGLGKGWTNYVYEVQWWENLKVTFNSLIFDRKLSTYFYYNPIIRSSRQTKRSFSIEVFVVVFFSDYNSYLVPEVLASKLLRNITPTGDVFLCSKFG